MRAALYARKSTDDSDKHDEARSCARQVEQARAYAQAKGWQVVREFVDDGISGALDADKRPALRAMLDAATAKAFDVLVTALPDRIARDQWVSAAIMARLAKASVRLFYVLRNQEADLQSAAGRFMQMAEAFGAASARESIRNHMIGSLKARAQAGAVTGNRAFGYKNVRRGPFVERVIYEPEARVIRRAFLLYSQGFTPTKIVRMLRDEGAPCPNKSGLPKKPNEDLPEEQRIVEGFWTVGPLLHILKQPLYRGTVVSTWGTEVFRVEKPELRIVPEPIWQAVQARLAESRSLYLRSARGHLLGKPPGLKDSQYLFSGLLQCSACGNPLTVRQKSRPYFMCRGHATGYFQRKAPCKNNLKLPVKWVDEEILGFLEQQVLIVSVIETKASKAIATLAQTVDQDSYKALKRNLKIVQVEIENLVRAVANGSQLTSLVTGLQEAEGRRDRITGQLESLEKAVALRDFNVKELRPALGERLKRDWSNLATRDPRYTRQLLRKLFKDRITITPRYSERDVTFRAFADLSGVVFGLIPADGNLHSQDSKWAW